MPTEKPTYFTKVLKTLSQLTTKRGFSVKQIAEQLQLLGAKRDLSEIKSIVEKSLRYGVKKKILLEKSGKFHLSASKLQSSHDDIDAEKKKKKRVRFKKGKTNINDVLRSKTRTSSVRRKSRRASPKSKRRSVKSKRSDRSRKRNVRKNSDESKERTENHERSQNAKKSGTELIVENKNKKEPLDVTPERDLHGNCVNKNKIRDKQVNVTEPPHLESETELGSSSPRPSTKLIRRNHSRHSSKVRKDIKQRYKHSCRHAMERKKRLKNFIPDDKSYRKYRKRSRHNCNNDKSEGSSEYEFKSKRKTCRKCRHHICHCYHQNHRYAEDHLLERKVSSTTLDHLNKSRTNLDATRKNLTPFEVFLEANQNKLETIAENISLEKDEPVEEVNDEEKNDFGTSYIN